MLHPCPALFSGREKERDPRPLRTCGEPPAPPGSLAARCAPSRLRPTRTPRRPGNASLSLGASWRGPPGEGAMTSLSQGHPRGRPHCRERPWSGAESLSCPRAPGRHTPLCADPLRPATLFQGAPRVQGCAPPVLGTRALSPWAPPCRFLGSPTCSVDARRPPDPPGQGGGRLAGTPLCLSRHSVPEHAGGRAHSEL